MSVETMFGIIFFLFGLCGIVFFTFIIATNRYKNNNTSTTTEVSTNKVNTIEIPINKKNRKIQDVKNGEKIKVNVSGFVVDAICLNNSPSDRKMFLRKILSRSTSDSVVEYSDHTFCNFNALNNIEQTSVGNNNKGLKAELTEKLQQAVKNEKYEEASILRDAISKIK